MNSIKNKKKNDKFGTKYFKTHVHRVISKIVFPTPNLTSNFETQKTVNDYYVYISRYIYKIYIPTNYEEI